MCGICTSMLFMCGMCTSVLFMCGMCTSMLFMKDFHFPRISPHCIRHFCSSDTTSELCLRLKRVKEWKTQKMRHQHTGVEVRHHAAVSSIQITVHILTCTPWILSLPHHEIRVRETLKTLCKYLKFSLLQETLKAFLIWTCFYISFWSIRKNRPLPAVARLYCGLIWTTRLVHQMSHRMARVRLWF